MFKKVFFIFVLCLGVFSVTAFAEDRALGLDDNKYYFSYVSSNDGNTYCYTYQQSYVDGYGQLCMKGNVRCYQVLDGSYVYLDTSSEIFCNSFYTGVSTNDFSLYSFLSDKGQLGDVISPPLIAPTVGEAIAKIPQGLSEQLKTLLPVGVTILSILLGVSLIPRLVRLFR